MLELAVNVEQMVENSKTFRPPPPPTAVLLPEMAYHPLPKTETQRKPGADGTPRSTPYRADSLRRAPAAASRYPTGKGSPPNLHIHVGGDGGRLTAIPRAGPPVPARPSQPHCCLPNMDEGALRVSEGSKELVEIGRA